MLQSVKVCARNCNAVCPDQFRLRERHLHLGVRAKKGAEAQCPFTPPIGRGARACMWHAGSLDRCARHVQGPRSSADPKSTTTSTANTSTNHWTMSASTSFVSAASMHTYFRRQTGHNALEAVRVAANGEIPKVKPGVFTNPNARQHTHTQQAAGTRDRRTLHMASRRHSETPTRIRARCRSAANVAIHKKSRVSFLQGCRQPLPQAARFPNVCWAHRHHTQVPELLHGCCVE